MAEAAAPMGVEAPGVGSGLSADGRGSKPPRVGSGLSADSRGSKPPRAGSGLSADGRADARLTCRERAAACGQAKGCAPWGGQRANGQRRGGGGRRPGRGKHTHCRPGSRRLPLRRKDPLASLCRQTLKSRAQRVKSPDLSHHLLSRVPRTDESFLSTHNFGKLFPAPLSALPCRRRLCLRVLAGTSPAFGVRKGSGPEKAT